MKNRTIYATLLALLLTLTTTAAANSATATHTISISIPEILKANTNLTRQTIDILDGRQYFTGTLPNEPLTVQLTANVDWQLTITANNQTHTITGGPDAYANLDLGDTSHLNLQPGDHITLQLHRRN